MLAIKFSLALGVICEILQICKYMTCGNSLIINCILLVAMHMFSFHWLLCNMVAFTVLSYSEILRHKVSFVQMRSPRKQAIKYKDFVKQDQYADKNTSVRDVFRTKVNICSGAFLRK